MLKSLPQTIQRFPSSIALKLLFLVFFWSPALWASMDAIVVADRAVIYSDQEMTSPLGYVARGKKIVVGDVSRNKGQVYPIIVSGKIGYIRVIDVSTERESMESERLVAERFKTVTHKEYKTKYVLSYYTFNSTMNLDEANPIAPDGSSFVWHGFSLKGEILLKKRMDLQVILNYMFAENTGVKLAVSEFGAGATYRLIDSRKILLRAEGHALLVPYSGYSYKNDFRVNSYGYTLGGALNLLYLFDEHWGAEVSGGLYRTSLLGFNAPDPYKDIAPVFMGSRIGIGLNYSY